MNHHSSSKVFTPSFLTKYEMASLIGVRIEQLSFGSPSLLDQESLKSCATLEDIATLELKQKKLPFRILRTLPNNVEVGIQLADLAVIS